MKQYYHRWMIFKVGQEKTLWVAAPPQGKDFSDARRSRIANIIGVSQGEVRRKIRAHFKRWGW
jgi:hypothetical protein